MGGERLYENRGKDDPPKEGEDGNLLYVCVWCPLLGTDTRYKVGKGPKCGEVGIKRCNELLSGSSFRQSTSGTAILPGGETTTFRIKKNKF